MNSNLHISCYILCGGKSSRMKSEKGLVKYLNKPFLQWIIEAVEPVTNKIFLVTDNKEYKVFNYPLVSDVFKNKGPVGGIYSALNHTKTDYNLILSCDVPNMSSKVIEKYLINNLDDEKDVIFLSDDKSKYPLIAVYNRRIVSNLFKAIEANKLKLISFIRELKIKDIKIDKVDYKALQNINTKEELINLEKKKIEIS